MLVSMYIICYNQENYIDEAISAAIQQTYQPLEIIISDDNSTDNTWNIIKQKYIEYTGPHRIIISKNETNLGISAHVNEIWKKCSGSWIVASAGDDVSEPSRVETIVAAIKQFPEIKLFQSFLTEIDQDGHELYINNLNINLGKIVHGSIYLPNRYEYESFSQHGAAMAYSREIVDVFGDLPEEVIFEDNILNVRAEILGGCGVIAKPLVRHRNHDGQITNSYVKNIRVIADRINKRFKSDYVTSTTNERELMILKSEKSENYYKYLNNISKIRKLHLLRYKSLKMQWPFNIIYFLAFILYNKNIISVSKREIVFILLPIYLTEKIIKTK